MENVTDQQLIDEILSRENLPNFAKLILSEEKISLEEKIKFARNFLINYFEDANFRKRMENWNLLFINYKFIIVLKYRNYYEYYVKENDFFEIYVIDSVKTLISQNTYLDYEKMKDQQLIDEILLLKNLQNFVKRIFSEKKISLEEKARFTRVFLRQYFEDVIFREEMENWNLLFVNHKFIVALENRDDYEKYVKEKDFAIFYVIDNNNPLIQYNNII